jgi:hypothetical protein
MSAAFAALAANAATMAQNASAARRRKPLRDGVWFDVMVVSPFITCLRVLDRSGSALPRVRRGRAGRA